MMYLSIRCIELGEIKDPTKCRNWLLYTNVSIGEQTGGRGGCVVLVCELELESVIQFPP